MAKAFKCDRCGNFFEPTSFMIPYLIEDREKTFKPIDICPACELDFMNWFNSGKPSKEGEKIGK